MSWVAVAVGAGALISGAAGVYSSNKANKAQQGASDASIGESRRQFDTIMGLVRPQINFSTGAMDQLSRLYGRGRVSAIPSGTPGGTAMQPNQFSVNTGPSDGASLARRALDPKTALRGAFDPIGATIDSTKFFGGLLGSQHGDEKRNLRAFTEQNQIYDVGDGMLALADGTRFPRDKLQDVAGYWYGATYAPDGDQQGWQQRYQGLIAPWNTGDQQMTAGGGPQSVWTTPATPDRVNSQGYQPTGSGGVRQIMQAGNGPVTIDNATGSVTPTASSGPDMSVFFESPDFQFNLAEGQKAIDRSAAARGGLLSGRAVKEGTRYASGLASREYAGFVDRLMQQAGLGNTGIGAATSAALNTGSNVSGALMNAGNARASSYLNTGMAINNAAQGGIQNYLLSRYLSPGG